MLQIIKGILVICVAICVAIIAFPLSIVNWDWRIYPMIDEGMEEVWLNWIKKS